MTNTKSRKFIETIIPSDTMFVAMDWIADNFDPEDVFTYARLETWAEQHGWIREPPEPEEYRS